MLKSNQSPICPFRTSSSISQSSDFTHIRSRLTTDLMCRLLDTISVEVCACVCWLVCV